MGGRRSSCVETQKADNQNTGGGATRFEVVTNAQIEHVTIEPQIWSLTRDDHGQRGRQAGWRISVEGGQATSDNPTPGSGVVTKPDNSSMPHPAKFVSKHVTLTWSHIPRQSYPTWSDSIGAQFATWVRGICLRGCVSLDRSPCSWSHKTLNYGYLHVADVRKTCGGWDEEN
ncbi:glutamate decarboxylase 2 [Striga asiatica]|uniref:Glutamate decarboxylase 2 n=1 Tax=Striga asiatica TaxID=4170 RepID=A0A5A7RFN2_STRAF|nr:glutamate decarboxylase 2 [Striga asiatica]